jgi:hypothetical protein
MWQQSQPVQAHFLGKWFKRNLFPEVFHSEKIIFGKQTNTSGKQTETFRKHTQLNKQDDNFTIKLSERLKLQERKLPQVFQL